MIERYQNKKITDIFSDEQKLKLWQETELSVIAAMEDLHLMPVGIHEEICDYLKTPIDIQWWKKRDEEIHHDLNAFLDERVRHLPAVYHQYFHKNITSYDTEEPAFAKTLTEAVNVIFPLIFDLEETLTRLAVKYRYTIMNGRTHGQEAEMQSFGARILTWLVELRLADDNFEHAAECLNYSKLSGAIGKYGSLDPRIEERALDLMGFSPLYGATQIMPRILYAPLAQNLCNLVIVIDKIGHDIRLASRSGRPLLQEPFKKKQKGSSAMPHKKNTIRTEQLEGMARMAKGYMLSLTDNIKTWEERAIEQSCVERVAWPDLFHVTAQALKVLNGVLSNLTVYPENMLKEIHESRGVYASSEVKEFLKTKFSGNGLDYEDAYRIVQIACFNVFEPQDVQTAEDNIQSKPSFQAAEDELERLAKTQKNKVISIQHFIPMAQLRISPALDIEQGKIDQYNLALNQLFTKYEVVKEWKKLFSPEFLLKNENFLYKKILDI
ncbi:MAG: lyase family protein [Patescibacteria group bacterium]